MRILLVEDSLHLRARLKRSLLAIEGCEIVGEATDAVGAVELACAFTPDLMVLDIHLRAGTGLQVLERLRARGLHPTVVVLTNCIEKPYLDAAHRLGADYFFRKSSEFEEAVECIRRLVAASVV